MNNWQNNPDNPLLNVDVRDDEELATANNTMPLETEQKADLAERTDNVAELSVLGQTRKESYDGDFLMGDGGCAEKERGDFKNVHTTWQKQCMTFEQGREVLAKQQAHIADVKGPMSDWEPGINDKGQVGLRRKATGVVYIPTSNALGNIAQIGKSSSWMLNDLTSDKVKATDEDDVEFERDERDADVLMKIFELLLFQFDRVDQDKVRLFRTWDDGTLRAVLSKDYTVVNNEWFLHTIAQLIPNGMLSHWRGDADSIFGNVLIPDSIRKEADSDYGGMLSIGNSEIGTRRLLSVPSVFRAICMNGCIWDHEQGKGINKVHRCKDGLVDYKELRAAIKVNLEKQIPLIEMGIRFVLEKRDFGIGSANVLQALAAIATEFKLQKRHARGMVTAFRTEVAILGSGANTAFGIMNAITRFGQTQGNTQWVDLDIVAGKLARMTRPRWDAVIKRAETLQDKDLKKVFGRGFESSI